MVTLSTLTCVKSCIRKPYTSFMRNLLLTDLSSSLLFLSLVYYYCSVQLCVYHPPHVPLTSFIAKSSFHPLLLDLQGVSMPQLAALLTLSQQVGNNPQAANPLAANPLTHNPSAAALTAQQNNSIMGLSGGMAGKQKQK